LSSRVLKYYQAQVDDTNKVTISTRPELVSGVPDLDEVPKPRKSANEDLRQVEEMFDKARRGADVILSSASENAAKMVEDAKEQAEEAARQIEKDALERGYAEGLKSGASEGERLRSEADAVLEDARRQRDEIIGSIERDVVELIAKLLNKLLVNTIEINPAIVAMLVRGQLGNMNATGDVTIRVSPEDYDEVLRQRDEIAGAVDTSVNIEITKDVTFKKAECILETPLGSVDISLESSYRMLKENLTYLFKMGELYEDR